jgi:hypothetical protein
VDQKALNTTSFTYRAHPLLSAERATGYRTLLIWGHGGHEANVVRRLGAALSGQKRRATCMFTAAARTARKL